MSRYHVDVPAFTAQALLSPFVGTLPTEGTVTLAIGYDRPLHSYFMDIGPYFEQGVFSGGYDFGLETQKQIGRGDMLELCKKFCDALDPGDAHMQLTCMANAIALDIPF